MDSAKPATYGSYLSKDQTEFFQITKKKSRTTRIWLQFCED